MKRLHTELTRLYLTAPAEGQDTNADENRLIDADGQTRALVLTLARPADWGALSPLWQGVQADLELPAPGIAVTGVDGLQLWFSLVQAVPIETARQFLEQLRLRYLNQVPPARISLAPTTEATASGQPRHARLVPALQDSTGHWSAFVSSDLAAVFADDPWLDLPPGPDNQADLLSRLTSISADGFAEAQHRLRPPVAPDTTGIRPVSQPGAPLDPRRFLQGVMNDAAVPLALRIEAAKALLPLSAPPPGD